MLIEHIAETFGWEVKSDLHRAMCKAIMLYTSRCYTASQFIQQFHLLNDKKIFSRDFRVDISNNPYLARNLRYYLLNLGRYWRTKDFERHAKRLYEKFGVEKLDAVRAYRLFKDDNDFRRKIIAEAAPYRETLSIVHYKETIKNFDNFYPSLKRYAIFLTRTKLTFLVKYTNTPAEDFISELMNKALKEYLFKFPTNMADLHLQNYLKRAMHNHCINIIDAEQCERRARIVNVGKDIYGANKFELKCSSNNQLSLHPDQDGTANYEELESVSVSDSQVLHNSICIEQLLSYFSAFPKKEKFLRILLGQEDESFTLWLKERKIARANDTHVEVQEKIPADEYNKLIGEYLNLREKHIARFLEKVGKMLGHRS